MAADASRTPLLFDPTAFETFVFLDRDLHEDGLVTLRYGLDQELFFEERFRLPVPHSLDAGERSRVEPLVALLHWVAGVSYFKLAAPPQVRFEGDPPGPATAALLEALYSEGLGEFAYTNRLARLPRPRFAAEHGAGMGSSREPSAERRSIEPERVLVPVGGGKDSAVAIEIVRRSGLPSALFSIGDAPPIARTVAAAGLPWLMARRELDPELGRLNEVRRPQRPRPRDRDRDRRRAPVCVAERLRHRRDGQRALGLGGNLSWDGVEVNHQFSKSLRVERLLDGALRGARRTGPRLLGAAPRVGARHRPCLRPPRPLPRGVHQLQHDLPPGPGAAGDVLVL